MNDIRTLLLGHGVKEALINTPKNHRSERKCESSC